MPLVDVTTRAPTHRLGQVTVGDMGQSSTAGGFGLTYLWTIDNAIAREIPATAASIARRREHAAARSPGPRFEPRVAQARPALAGTGDA